MLTNNCNTCIKNISRSKGNQTIKFGQLIDHDMRNIFLEISYTKCGEEAGPRPFPEKLKFSISFIQFVYTVCQAKGYRNTLKLNSY